MQDLILLLSPRILGFRNTLTRSSRRSRKRALIVVSMGLGFWVLVFVLSSRVLRYFQSVDVIGDLLAHHLLAMILLTFFSLMVFSNIITALSNLYLSTDLQMCHSSPISLEKVFLSRSLYTFVDSSWMVIVFGMPVLMSYAYVYRPGPGYYVTLLHMGFALAIIAAEVGILATMVLVSIFPAQRTRDIVMLLSLFVMVALYFMFRFLRPERLVDPEAFFSVMQYVSALSAPDSPYLPSHWVTESLWSYLSGSGGRGQLSEKLLLWSTAAAFIVISIWAAEALYFSGFSKSQEAKRRRGGRWMLDLFTNLVNRPAGRDLASLMDKDIRTFFRDNTQWSQLMLLGALVVVYLYNFSVLPLEKSPVRLEYLQNELAFLNTGLAGFVLSAVSVRFIFPAVSSEGGAFWIIRSSPVSLRRFLWGKFFLYILPMVLLAEILIIMSNYFLGVTAFMMVLSAVTMFFAVLGMVSLAVGFGALYPSFNYQNIAQVSTGFGGLMYMIFSALFMAAILLVEAVPAYLIVMSGLRGGRISGLQWVFIISCFVIVLAINGAAIYKPIQLGVKALEEHE
jgi:ABC-2 type transport system permease protein